MGNTRKSPLTMFLFCSFLGYGDGAPFDLPYSVEVWDDNDQHIEELVALTGDIARAG